MTREMWMASRSLANGIMVLNSLFYGRLLDEPMLKESEKEELAKDLSQKITRMSLEDVYEILDKVKDIHNADM